MIELEGCHACHLDRGALRHVSIKYSKLLALFTHLDRGALREVREEEKQLAEKLRVGLVRLHHLLARLHQQLAEKLDSRAAIASGANGSDSCRSSPRLARHHRLRRGGEYSGLSQRGHLSELNGEAGSRAFIECLHRMRC